MRINDVALSHRSRFRMTQDASPSMRIGVLVACEPLGAEPPTSELRSHFLNFLERQPIMTLVTANTHVEQGALWTSYAGRGRINHEAALTARNIEDDEVPPALAMMLLTDVETSSFGRDPRFAELVLDIDLRQPDGTAHRPVPLRTWHEIFMQVFSLPGLFKQFLTEDLELITSADPPAQLGVWLKTAHSMYDLVDVENLPVLPGSHVSSWFMGYSFANPLGHQAPIAAAEFLQQMCDYTLHVDKYEPLLAELAEDRTS